jgi:hypothetical protein
MQPPPGETSGKLLAVADGIVKRSQSGLSQHSFRKLLAVAVRKRQAIAAGFGRLPAGLESADPREKASGGNGLKLLRAV